VRTPKIRHSASSCWVQVRGCRLKTGAIQIVEVRERVEQIAPRLPFDEPPAPKPKRAPLALFAKLTRENLLGVGVPEDWLADIAAAPEDAFLELAPHLPAEGRSRKMAYPSSRRRPRRFLVPAGLAEA
jgi:hypothetical protein